MSKRKKNHFRQKRIDSVRSFASRHPGMNEGGIRWIIFQYKDKLLEADAIFYCGKRVLIDEDRFISAIKQGVLSHG